MNLIIKQKKRDNGTGKTLTATLLAKGKFAKTQRETDSVEGLMYIRGSSYLYDSTGTVSNKFLISQVCVT